MNKLRRFNQTKSKSRTNLALRRRTQKKASSAAVTARNAVYRMSIAKEMEEQELAGQD